MELIHSLPSSWWHQGLIPEQEGFLDSLVWAVNITGEKNPESLILRKLLPPCLALFCHFIKMLAFQEQLSLWKPQAASDQWNTERRVPPPTWYPLSLRLEWGSLTKWRQVKNCGQERHCACTLLKPLCSHHFQAVAACARTRMPPQTTAASGLDLVL